MERFAFVWLAAQLLLASALRIPTDTTTKTISLEPLTTGAGDGTEVVPGGLENVADGFNDDPPAPSVTKKFCEQTLISVVRKEAPYFIDGKFTGESREALLDQCASHICDFAVKYKASVDEACDGAECPKDCSKPHEFMKDLLADVDSETKLAKIGKGLVIKVVNKKAPATDCDCEVDPACSEDCSGPSANDPRDPEYNGSTVISQAMPTGMYQPRGGPLPVPGATGPAGGAGPEEEDPEDQLQQLEKLPEPQVTQGFCKQMLADLAAKRAPYFVEGKFTGECRAALLQQCSQQICDWAKQYSDTIEGECKLCPTECGDPPTYVRGILVDGDCNSKEFQEMLGHITTTIHVHFPGDDSNKSSDNGCVVDCDNATEDSTVTTEGSVVHETVTPFVPE